MSKFTRYLIGMDCGTTNIKAVVLRSDGQIVATESRPSRFISNGKNTQEQDANEWWESAADIFRCLTDKIGEEATAQICGIAVSSHTVTMLPVDKKGNPLRLAMTYQDSRSWRELEEIVETIGREAYIKLVGGHPSVSFLPSKLLWYKRNEPELFAQTAAFLQASSFINFKLTGVMASDIDQALRSQCMDIELLDWSNEISQAIGIDLTEKLPPIHQVDDIIGFVSMTASDETGLAPGIPVIAGCSDAMSSMQATGISRLGEAGESAGTTSLVFVGSETRSAHDAPVVTRPCTIDGMPWLFDAPIKSTGAALKWYIDLFANEEKNYAKKNGLNLFDYLNDLALEAPAGSNGLYFFPYLLGERAPLWNDYAKGMFIGLTMETNRSDMIRSIFEGTAFALRHVIETVRLSGGHAQCLRVCGGGAKSRTWNKIKASVLNMPVYVLSEDSGNVPVGSALIVGHKVGIFPDLSEVTSKVVKVAEVIQSDRDWAAAYDRVYPFYVTMYQHLDKDLRKMEQVMQNAPVSVPAEE